MAERRAGGPPLPTGAVRFHSTQGRWVLLATILGSGVASLDATVVNVALPAIGRDLDAGVSGLQWTLNGYLLALAALILLGGSLGDRFGRRRVFVVGVAWFALASLLCGLAPTAPVLVVARGLQGVGGALLTPGSLAILQATFTRDDRARAIGAWSALGGVAAAAGPFLGGWFVSSVSWRFVFLLNLPLAAVVVVVSLRHVPESLDPTMAHRLDVSGALLGAVGLAGCTYALIEAPERGLSTATLAAGALGALGLLGFLVIERRSRHPMLPLDIFASRQFTSANLVTLAVYAALGGMFFLLAVHLQGSLGYSATEAGVAMFPVTVLMLGLSARAGEWATRTGPRLPMSLGPLVVALGLVLMARIAPGQSYASAVLPAAVVFGLGLSLTVAPLTATALASAADRHSGVASGVNNAVARAAQLLAVAVLPLVSGITGDDFLDPNALTSGFRTAALVTAGLAALGALVAWTMIRDDVLSGGEDRLQQHDEPASCGHSHCSLDGPPLRDRQKADAA